MGEKIRDMSSFTIGNTDVKIELNDGYSKAYSKYDIHIQSDAVQYCLSGSDFMKAASSFIIAKRSLDAIKKSDIK